MPNPKEVLAVALAVKKLGPAAELAGLADLLPFVGKGIRSPLARIHPSAFVHESVSVLKGAEILPHVTIDAGAVIGRYATLGTKSMIGRNSLIGGEANLATNVSIGERSVLGQFVSATDSVQIGNRSVIQLRTFIGEHARVGNRVLIGANNSIAPHSVIGNGTSLGTPAKAETAFVRHQIERLRGTPARPEWEVISSLKREANKTNDWFLHGLRTLRHPAEMRVMLSHYQQLYPKSSPENVKFIMANIATPGTEREWLAALASKTSAVPRY